MKKVLMNLGATFFMSSALLAGGTAEYFYAEELFDEMQQEESFFKDYFEMQINLNSIKKEFIETYANNYTEKELNQMRSALRLQKELLETIVEISQH